MSEEKRVIELDESEFGAVVDTMYKRRNEMIEKQEDSEFISEVLEKIIKAPTKKKMFVKKERYER